jgi:hypothetical protein
MVRKREAFPGRAAIEIFPGPGPEDVPLPMCPGRTNRSMIAGVPYIAKPTTLEAQFSYRRAPDTRCDLLIVRQKCRRSRAICRRQKTSLSEAPPRPRFLPLPRTTALHRLGHVAVRLPIHAEWPPFFDLVSKRAVGCGKRAIGRALDDSVQIPAASPHIPAVIEREAHRIIHEFC